jgi:glutamyl-Q tRNA(Asp) synthetase
MTETVTRFAPSPTGLLHLGHAHSALAGWRAARQACGRFLLRIEDIDRTRCRPEFTAAILEDLAWLGLAWDDAPRVQSQHMEDYRAALETLRARDLLYPCFCTRADIAAASAAPHEPEAHIYPGTCRTLDEAARASRVATGAAYAWRLDVARALAETGPLGFVESGKPVVADPASQGDVVLARKDTPTSYHLAVTLDDALQGVTLVTRGVDLAASTHIHRLLQALLDLPVPEYRHHALRLDEAGKRYAKRDRALTLQALREAGKTPAEVRALARFPD